MSQETKAPSIPGYEILHLIGQGAMGTVYKARQSALDRPVAIKVLRSELSKQTRYLERLQREAKLTARLDHPNVVKGIDYGVSEGRPFFVMEYAEGKTLKEQLKERGRFSEDQSIEIALQIASALEHAYRHGIVHRDVKPGNVILTAEGSIKLTDLGLARRPGDPTVTHAGSTMGTPQYISPEQARNPSAVDVRSDIYSLGATLYHLVTGTPPFAGESLADLLTKVLFEKAESASLREPSVSPGFSLVLRKMLAKEPGKRYQTPGELIEDLKRVQAHLSPSITEKSLVEESSRSPLLLFSGAAALLLVAAGAVWLLRSPREEKAESQNAAPVDLAALRLAEAHEIESARLRQATEAGSRRISEEMKFHRFDQVQSLLESRFAELFEKSMGVPLASPGKVSAFVENEWSAWLQKEERLFSTRLQKVVESFAEELDRNLSQKKKNILELIAAHRFQSASAAVDGAMEDFRSLEGVSLEDLPPASRKGLVALERFRSEMEEKIRASADEIAQQALQSIRAAFTAFSEKLSKGAFLSRAAEFEGEIGKILQRFQLKSSELPGEWQLRLDREIEGVKEELAGKEESIRREAAQRVMEDLDREFAPALKQRDYEMVLKEWRQLEGKPLMIPAKEEIQARIEELAALAALRERFGRAVESFTGKTIEIREGAIRKTGRVLNGFHFRTGEFVLEPEKAPRIVCFFASIHPETVGRFCGILDSKSGKELSGLSDQEIYAWAIFQLYEGNFSAAKPFLSRLARLDSFESRAALALRRLETQEKNVQENQQEKERQAATVLEAAQRFALVGEFPRSRAKYAQLFRDFSDSEAVKSRREALEAQAAQVVESEKAAERSEFLRELFPGAEILPLSESRFFLRYSFRGQAPGAWKMSEQWMALEGGVRRKLRCRDASEFKSAPGPQISLPLSLASGVKVFFRITFPFESGFPFFDCFTVAGHSFGVWSGGENAVGQVASWSGGPELYESHFHHPGLTGNGSARGFRFLRGGSYEIAVELLPGGKEAIFFIDGEEMARSKLVELSPTWKDRVEFRAWESAELREVTVEGVNGGGK